MSADEKQYLYAVLARDMDARDVASTLDQVGRVLCAEIARIKAEIAAERARCTERCRHG